MNWKVFVLIACLFFLCAGALSLLIIMKEGSPAERTAKHLKHRHSPKPHKP